MKPPRSKLTKKKLKRILRYLKPYLVLELGIAIGMIIIVGLALLDPLVLKILIDDVLVDRNITLLNILIIALIGLILLRSALNIFTNYIFSFVGQRILFDIRFSLFQHIEKLPLSFFSRTKTGEIMSRVNNDVERLRSVVTTTFVSLITDLVTLVAIFGVILYLDWRLTLLSLTLFPFFFISQVHLGKKIKRKSREAREKSADILSFFQETISGIELVQSFVKERFEARRLLRKSKELINLRIGLGVLGAVASSIAGFLAAMGPIIVLWYGGREVIQGALSIGGLVAFYAYVGRLFSPVFRLAQHNVAIQTAMASIDRIFEYFDLPCREEGPESIVLRRVNGHVEFRNVSFSHNHAKPILKNVSFEVKSGQKVAFVGRVGQGKSTIINLICRFYDPHLGSILLDGQDIRGIKLSSLRTHVGVVSQQTILFNSTIKENLQYGKTKATDQEIIDAAQKAHIHDFICSLPEKYETIIGDRGFRLSGGERQKLSIARTILRDPKILIFDEATAALDSRSERLIQRSIEPLMRDRTSIIIAHRLSTIVDVDNILVLNDGRVVESGNHEELIHEGGVYRMLWEEMARKENSH